ncbi:MAG: adenylosuccinate synthetase [Actinomycetales bacterium]
MGAPHRPEALVVVGLGFGDEGKGATVDWLADSRRAQGRPAALAVRFNGGAQAAHNVVTPDGREHTFSQFASATFCGVPTHLTRDVLVEPMMLAAEARALSGLGVDDPLELVTLDPDALVTTPIQVAANRAREDRRGDRRHGSCGKGIGETRWYDEASTRRLAAGQYWGNLAAPGDVTGTAVRVRDCRDRRRLIAQLDAMARCYAPLLAGTEHGHRSVGELADLLSDFGAGVRLGSDARIAAALTRGPVLFEGAQGVLLDEWRGFHPHTTWSVTEPSAARRLLARFSVRPTVIGVTRTYHTRHGAGPLPSQTQAELPERHNGTGRYQGAWRVGHLDLVLLRYAARACGPIDRIAITHLDADPAGDQVGLVDHYLDQAGRAVHDLALGPTQDLDHQTRLTRLVSQATPVTRTATGPERVRAIEQTLRAPTLVTATGPSRTERALRDVPDSAAA